MAMRYSNVIKTLLAALLLGLLPFAATGQPEPGSLDAPPAAEEPPEEPQGEEAETERFDDWLVRCGEIENNGETARACEMLQQVSQEETNQPVMEIAIGYLGDEERPVAVFTLPLGIRLPPGVQLQVGDAEPVRIPVQICVRQGCRADLLLEEDLVAAMRQGTEMQLSVLDPRGERVDLPISLLGFTAALERISP